MESLSERGWVLIAKPYQENQIAQLHQTTRGIGCLEDTAVRRNEGAVYAARNVLELCPQLASDWQTPTLTGFVQQVLGRNAGLVRALYFDKPPEQTWALPWHKDLLIAVQEDAAAPGYSRPRLRVGVWHTEPPLSVLESMLTLRIHLDPMTETNGPLQVLSGSHRTGKQLECTGFDEVTILSDAGDVLAMRPLLVHASGRSDPNSVEHRRVLHLEFSGMPVLPGGVCWHRFHPIDLRGLS